MRIVYVVVGVVLLLLAALFVWTLAVAYVESQAQEDNPPSATFPFDPYWQGTRLLLFIIGLVIVGLVLVTR